MTIVSFLGETYFAVTDDKKFPGCYILHTGEIAECEACKVEAEMSAVWNELQEEALPALIAYCFEHAVEIIDRHVYIDGEKRAPISGNPFISLIMAVFEGAAAEGYTAVYYGPGLHEATAMFEEAVIKGYHTRNCPIEITESMNAILEMMEIITGETITI